MGKVNVRKLTTFAGHTDCVYTMAPSFKSNQFYSSGADGQVVSWDINKPDEGKVIAKVDSSVYSLCYDSTRNWLIIGQNFEGVHIINVDNNTLVKSIDVTKSAIFDIVVTKDRLVIACGDGELIIVELNNFTTLAKLKLSDKSARCISLAGEDHIYVGYSDHFIRKIDLISFSLKQEWKAHENSVFSLAYFFKEDHLFSVGRDAQIREWNNLDNRVKELSTVPAHMYTINHIAFRADQKIMATCSMDKSIKIWDVETKTLLKVIDNLKFPAHGTSVNRLLWNSDNTLLSCSDDRTVTAWQIEIESER